MKTPTTKKPSKIVRIKARIARMETRNKMAALKMQKRQAKIAQLKTRLTELR